MTAALEKFAISYVRSKHDNKPQRASVSWAEFCAQFANPRRTACSVATCGTGDHAEIKDGKPIGCRHKNGRAWIPATFSSGRKAATVENLSMLVVDADHLPDRAALDAVLAKLSRYQYVAHATHSDKDGNRCARIVLPLSRPVPGIDWERFWPAAMAVLGMPADPSCCDAGRLYYLPARPSDADYFYVTHDGDPIDVMAIVASAPPLAPTIADSLDVDDDGKVTAGRRHAMLKSLAGSMRRRGAGAEEILISLREANKRRCDPPKADSELADLAKWAAAQPVKGKGSKPLPVVDSEHAPSYTEDDDNARRDFERDPKTNAIYHTQRNVALAMAKLGVSVRYDEFPRYELVDGLAGYGPRLDDDAMRELRLRIDERFSFRIAKEFFGDVVARRARQNSFHSVRDYLAGLTWDEKPRIDRWLIDYAGAADTNYTLAVSRLFLVAAVRRVRKPGCKFDEMPILESVQGTNKSTALRILAVRDDWFADDLPLNGDTKQLLEQTAGKWIVEAGELKGMGRAEQAALKACLSRQVDEARMAYGHKQTIVPRQFVIIGTTNEKGNYLRDSTGNRRYWPVRVKQFNLEQLAAVRDQLWAEAAAAEAAGESIRLDPALYSAAAAEQEEREADDSMLVEISEQLDGRTGKIRTRDLWALLNIEPGKATQDQNARVGAAMQKLGWERLRRHFDGKLEYAYVKGDESARQCAIEVDVQVLGGVRRINVTGGSR